MINDSMKQKSHYNQNKDMCLAI